MIGFRNTATPRVIIVNAENSIRSNSFISTITTKSSALLRGFSLRLANSPRLRALSAALSVALVGTIVFAITHAGTDTYQILAPLLDNKCITATAQSSTATAAGKPVVLSSCADSNALQQWQYHGNTGQFASVGNANECLAIQNGASWDWTPLVTAPCITDDSQVADSAQSWKRTKAKPGDLSGNTTNDNAAGAFVTFVNPHSKACLDDRAHLTTDGNPIQIYHCYWNKETGQPNKAQMWQLKSVPNTGGQDNSGVGTTSGNGLPTLPPQALWGTAGYTTGASSFTKDTGSSDSGGSGGDTTGDTGGNTGGTGTGGDQAAGDTTATDCSKSGLSPATLSGNTFSGGVYNGNGATLSGNYSVGPNTCVENYTFSGTLAFASGASNATIVNNKFTNSSNQTINNLTNGGSDNTIAYNSFAAHSGYADLFGGGGGNTNMQIVHNYFDGGASDKIQENCTGVCTNQTIAYNKFNNLQGFSVELLYIWHTAHFSSNYISYSTTLVNHGCNGCNDQTSISPFNKAPNPPDTSDTQYTQDGTTNFVVDHNISIGSTSRSPAGAYPACFEARGSGLTYSYNYCLRYASLCDYANNNNPVVNGAAWHTDNNTIIGSGGDGKCVLEGGGAHYEMPGYSNTKPNGDGSLGTGDKFYLSSANPPSIPAWTYANGAQW